MMRPNRPLQRPSKEWPRSLPARSRSKLRSRALVPCHLFRWPTHRPNRLRQGQPRPAEPSAGPFPAGSARSPRPGRVLRRRCPVCTGVSMNVTWDGRIFRHPHQPQCHSVTLRASALQKFLCLRWFVFTALLLPITLPRGRPDGQNADDSRVVRYRRSPCLDKI